MTLSLRHVSHSHSLEKYISLRITEIHLSTFDMLSTSSICSRPCLQIIAIFKHEDVYICRLLRLGHARPRWQHDLKSRQVPYVA